jgi:hypothetical protein
MARHLNSTSISWNISNISLNPTNQYAYRTNFEAVSMISVKLIKNSNFFLLYKNMESLVLFLFRKPSSKKTLGI